LRYTVESAPAAGLETGISLTFPVSGAKNFRSIKIENPQLWMPNGYGDPNLYTYKVELLRDGKVIDEYSNRLGLREVELVQKPLGEDALSFYLKINGVDVFVKGSNWVPCECFTGTVEDAKYEKLVRFAKDGNFNMLRIWGGGIYEKDIFYRLCDELGIMVWQDFMFACADIPEMDTDFVANVTKECIYQIKRLRNHPSIVYWCGGNEKTGSCGLLKQYGDYLVDITIRGLVEHYDGTRPYIRQSPFSWTDIGNDELSGETHGTSFDIVLLENYDEFLKASFNKRVSFSSECATMGSCVVDSYYKFVPEDELWPMGEIYDDRFCDNPYGTLMSFVNRQQKAVEMMFGEAHSIEEFAVKSMASQAEVLKIEILNRRRNRKTCGGFMNWMFSDIWPTGTWAVVDYFAQPKMGYYAMKREFAPFRGYILPNGEGKYFAGFINDTTEPITVVGNFGGVTVDGQYISKKSYCVTVEPCDIFEFGAIDVEGDVLFLQYESEKYSSVATVVPALFKDVAWCSDYQATVGESKKTCKGYETEVKISANSYVRGLYIKVDENAVCSDNWFDILPGQEVVITIQSKQIITEKDLLISDYTQWID
jgi:beta-mannosidase